MWIELHDGARDHPKIIKPARDLGITRAHALGHMCSLWLWVLRMAPDGDLSSFDGEDIEIAAGWEGEPGEFSAAANARRLLDIEKHGMVIHDWQEYATHLKAAERKRIQRQKKRDKAEMSQDVTGRPRHVTGQASKNKPVTLTDRPTDRPTERRQTQVEPLVDVGARRIQDHYLSKFPKRKAQTKACLPKIKARLGEGYSVEQICKAIDGCLSRQYNAENGYNNLELIVRSAKQIDLYLEDPKPKTGTKDDLWGPYKKLTPEPDDDEEPPPDDTPPVGELASPDEVEVPF